MVQTLTAAAITGAEAALQKALRYDPASRRALARLDGQVLALQFTQPACTLYLVPDPQGLSLHQHWEGSVTSRLTGPPAAFLGLLRDDPTSLAGSGVQLEGSTQLIQALQRIAAQLDIDWEEALSEVVGDVAGHQSAEWLRTGAHWLQGREAQARRLLSEFITQEAELLPSRPELEHFYREVDELALAVERAEARLTHLASRFTPTDFSRD